MNGIPPYSNVQQGVIPPDVQVDYIIQKQLEDQITVQQQQANAAGSNPPSGQQ